MRTSANTANKQPPVHRPPPPPPVLRWAPRTEEGNQTGPSGIDVLTADNAITSAQAGPGLAQLPATATSSEALRPPPTPDPFSAFFDDEIPGEARVEPDSSSPEQYTDLDFGGDVAGATGPPEERDVGVFNFPRTTQERESKEDRLARERAAPGEPKQDSPTAAAAGVAIKKQNGNNGDTTPESRVRGLLTGGGHCSESSDEENPNISAKTNAGGAPSPTQEVRPAVRPAPRKKSKVI